MRRREFIAGLGSAAAAWPLAAGAQQARPVIGFLRAGSESSNRTLTAAFLRGLGEQGYTEGRNVEILYRYADGQFDRLPAFAADLVSRRVAVIAAMPTPAALAAKAATATIPIVIAQGSDPVRDGLVTSLNHPGGNVTGAAAFATNFVAKRFELMHQLAPAATEIGFVIDLRVSTSSAAQLEAAEAAANALGVRLIVLNGRTPDEIENAFAAIAAQRIGALVVGNSALFVVQRDQLVALAARHRVPAIYEDRLYVEVGGLMSYGGGVSH